MSSIDFHEDEWGRHWSHAPIRQHRLPHHVYRTPANLAGWIAARIADMRHHWLASQDRQAFARMSAESLRDIFSDDQPLPRRDDRFEHVRDFFGRPLA